MRNTLKAEITKRFEILKPIIAVNVESLDQIIVLNNIARELNQLIIIQFSARNINWFFEFYGDHFLFKNFKYLFFHLDHCDQEKTIKKCINLGFDSFMYDGSNMDIKDNIESVIKYQSLASKHKVLIEVEVGPIKGVEEGFGSSFGSNFKIEDAIKLYNEAKFDLLALTIGNAHGVYHSLSEIKPFLLKEFQECIPNYIPLVLHGGTGLSSQILKECVSYGCVKVNYSTEFKKSFKYLKNTTKSQEELLVELRSNYFKKIKKFYDLWY